MEVQIMENTITENLLRELLEEVQLLTVQAKVDALQKFKNDFLIVISLSPL